MQKKEKTKRFGIIIMELVFLIAILIGIVKLNANANNGPEINGTKALSNGSDAHSLSDNRFLGNRAVSPELKGGIKAVSLKEISNTLPQAPVNERFEINAEPISLNYETRLDWEGFKLNQTEAISEVFYSKSRFSKYDLTRVSKFSDSIPIVSQPAYHKYLAPQIVLGIGKK
jgi:hypothetical protein